MSSDIPVMTTYIRNPAVAATEIDAETFLVEPEEGEVFYLDEISSALWRFLTEARSEDDIVETFAAAFPDTDRAQMTGRIALPAKRQRHMCRSAPVYPAYDPGSD
jgi:hypothetical protein